MQGASLTPARRDSTLPLIARWTTKGKAVTHEILGNLSHLPDHLIDLIKRSLKGETFVSAADAFRITRSLPHGHVEAVLAMIRKLGVEEILASAPSRRRDLVVAMIAERLLFPKLEAGQHPTLARHHLGRGVGRRRRH